MGLSQGAGTGTGPRQANGRWLKITALLVGLVTLGVYLPSIACDWVNWDDTENFINNPHFRGFTGENIVWMLTQFRMGHYHPLTWFTLAANYEAGGMNPAGYHFVNVMLHAISAGLLVVLLAMLVRRRSGGAVPLVAVALAALLWSLHPLRVEAVTWVTQRREVLCGVLSLLTLIHHVRGGRWWGTLLLGLLAMTAKATAVVLPVLLVLLDVDLIGGLGAAGWVRMTGRAVLRHAPLFVLGIACSVTATFAQREAAAMVPLEALPWSGRITLYFYGLGFYGAKTVWPSGLAPLHHGDMGPTWELPRNVLVGAMVSAVVVGSAVTGAWLLRRRVPALLLMVLAYIAMVAPVGGLGQSGPQFVAERYAYQPGWVLAAMMLGGMLMLVGRWRALRLPVVGASGLCAAVLAEMCVRQQGFWKNSELLWKRQLEVYPGDPLAYFDLGGAVHNRSRPDLAEAERLYRLSIAGWPKYVGPRVALADVLRETGRLDEAQVEFGAALELEPTNRTALNALGRLRWDSGAAQEAIVLFDRLAAADPENPESYRQLGRALAAVDRCGDARKVFERGAALTAISRELLMDYAWMLSTNPNDSVRDGKRAVELVQRARERGGDEASANDPRMIIATCAAYAEAGDFERAAREIEHRLTGVPTDATAALRHLADQMRARVPVRAPAKFP